MENILLKIKQQIKFVERHEFHISIQNENTQNENNYTDKYLVYIVQDISFALIMPILYIKND